MLPTLLFVSLAAMTNNLDRVAETATVMLDGDLCRKIQTPRSIGYQTRKDPRDPWRYGDNYEVDYKAFLTTKKTLIRLSHLCSTPCDVNLWMPSESVPDRVQIVIRNVLELSQFWKWGDIDQPIPPEMKESIQKKTRVVVQHKPGAVSVLAPVLDSLGDVVGLAEVVSQLTPDPRENVQ